MGLNEEPGEERGEERRPATTGDNLARNGKDWQGLARTGDEVSPKSRQPSRLPRVLGQSGKGVTRAPSSAPRNRMPCFAPALVTQQGRTSGKESSKDLAITHHRMQVVLVELMKPMLSFPCRLFSHRQMIHILVGWPAALPTYIHTCCSHPAPSFANQRHLVVYPPPASDLCSTSNPFETSLHGKENATQGTAL